MKRLLAMLAMLMLLTLPALAEETDLQPIANQAYARVLLDGARYLPLTEDARMPDAWKPVRFTLLDMDHDGLCEVIIELTEWEAFVVLTWEAMTDAVYGGEFTYRGMLDLKDDGTFTFSSGAMDNGVAELSFLSGGTDELQMGYLPLAECRSEEDGSVSFWLDGGAERTDEAGYQAYIAQQSAKLDALWYDYTEDNIRLLLGQ